MSPNCWLKQNTSHAMIFAIRKFKPVESDFIGFRATQLAAGFWNGQNKMSKVWLKSFNPHKRKPIYLWCPCQRFDRPDWETLQKLWCPVSIKNQNIKGFYVQAKEKALLCDSIIYICNAICTYVKTVSLSIFYDWAKALSGL